MHLLVLSAFRRLRQLTHHALLVMSQCTFWCSVLSDRLLLRAGRSVSFVSMHLLVLSAFRLVKPRPKPDSRAVSMHLLVLSAFRRLRVGVDARVGCVSMHLLVLSAFRQDRKEDRNDRLQESQCTFWCSVLSDPHEFDRTWKYSVSMHLLVLSAFRLEIGAGRASVDLGLNAPFGAQCFPTEES